MLAATGIRKRFGGVMALQRGELTLAAGEVLALIGANGSGKSTLGKILAGSVAPDAGEIRLDGRPVRFAGPRQAAAAGIGAFYQELSLIPQLTVAENIFLGREPRNALGFIHGPALRAAAEAAVAAFAPAVSDVVRADVLVGDLAADQRQIVEILKVLVEDPRLVIFDEPTAALDRRQVAAFFERVRALRDAGRGIIFISHRMDEVFAIGDRVSVMRNGETVLTRSIGETTREELVAAMVGGAIAGVRQRRRSPAAPPVLEVEEMHGARLRGVSLALRRGEVLGLGGLHGQGQSELLRALFGAAPAARGRIRLDGAPVTHRRPADALRRSIAYVSGDRSRDGLLPVRSIFENLVVSLVAKRRQWRLRRRALGHVIVRVAERLGLTVPALAAPVAQLSGGSQQKVLLGRWLVTEPQILLLDDPTKGVDLKTKEDLYALLDELCAGGASVLFYSSDDEELLASADRVLVLNGGAVTADLVGETLTRTALYHAAYATGGLHVGA